MFYDAESSCKTCQRGLLFRKATAIFVILAFVLFDVSRYAPQAIAGQSSKVIEPVAPASFSIPKELGSVDEVYRGERGTGNGERNNEIVNRSSLAISRHDQRIVLIQDAHDSLEAQVNIAKIIRLLVERDGVRTVFEEGYEGPVPTDKFFGFIKDPATKEKVSYFMMDQLRIGGAEYAHINRRSRLDQRPETGDSSKKDQSFDGKSLVSSLKSQVIPKDFELIGVEDLKLYGENIKCYQDSSQSRKDIEEDLAELWGQITTLANQYFPKDLKTWMKARKLFSEGKLPLLNYLKELQAFYLKSPESRSAWDFAKEYPAISMLLMAETTHDPKLNQQLNALDFKGVFEEITRLEKNVSVALLQNERDREIFTYYQGLGLLKRLNRIELTQAEYEAVQTTLRRLDTRRLADFIVSLTRRPLVLSREWERHIQEAVRFYEVALQRDGTISGAMDKYIEAGNVERGTGNEITKGDVESIAQNEKSQSFTVSRSPSPAPAVLVYGGFHANSIKEMLREKGISYVVISPRITSANKRHQDFYKQLMTEGHRTFETPFLAAHANKPPSIFYSAAVAGEDASAQSTLRAITSSVEAMGNISDPQLIERRLAGLNPGDQVQPESVEGGIVKPRSELRGKAFDEAFEKGLGFSYTEEALSIPGQWGVSARERFFASDGTLAPFYSLSLLVAPDHAGAVSREMTRLQDDFYRELPFAASKFFRTPSEAIHLTLWPVRNSRKTPFSDSEVTTGREETEAFLKDKQPFDIDVAGVAIDEETGRIRVHAFSSWRWAPRIQAMTLMTPLEPLTADETSQVQSWVIRNRDRVMGLFRAEKAELVHLADNFSIRRLPVPDPVFSLPSQAQPVVRNASGGESVTQAAKRVPIGKALRDYFVNPMKFGQRVIGFGFVTVLFGLAWGLVVFSNKIFSDAIHFFVSQYESYLKRHGVFDWKKVATFNRRLNLLRAVLSVTGAFFVLDRMPGIVMFTAFSLAFVIRELFISEYSPFLSRQPSRAVKKRIESYKSIYGAFVIDMPFLGFVFALIAISAVAAHEAGHFISAKIIQKRGKADGQATVQDIVYSLFPGFVTTYSPDDFRLLPIQRIWIAVSGPLMELSVACVSFILWYLGFFPGVSLMIFQVSLWGVLGNLLTGSDGEHIAALLKGSRLARLHVQGEPLLVGLESFRPIAWARNEESYLFKAKKGFFIALQAEKVPPAVKRFNYKPWPKSRKDEPKAYPLQGALVESFLFEGKPYALYKITNFPTEVLAEPATAPTATSSVRSEMHLNSVDSSTSRDSREARSEMPLNPVDSSTTRDSLEARSEMRLLAAGSPTVSDKSVLSEKQREALLKENWARFFRELNEGTVPSLPGGELGAKGVRHVLSISPQQLKIGGIQTYQQNLIKTLLRTEKGFTFELLYLGAGTEPSETLFEAPKSGNRLVLHGIPKRSPDNIPLTDGEVSIHLERLLAEIQRRMPIDLIALNSSKAQFILLKTALSFSHQLRIPSHYFFHGGAITEGVAYLVRNSDAAVTCSNAFQKIFSDLGSEKVERLYPISDMSYFLQERNAEDRMSVEALRKQYGLSGKKIILHPSRIEPRKGQEVTLRAAAELLRQDPARSSQLSFVVLGPEHNPLQNDLAKLQDLAKSLKVEVLFVGGQSVEQMRRWYDASYLVVYPTLGAEPFGLVPVEAQASGVPAIVSDGGGLPETLVEGVTGFVIPRGNYRDLARRIGQLAGDEAERDQMGAMARKSAEERFAFSANLKAIGSSFLKAVQEHSVTEKSPALLLPITAQQASVVLSDVYNDMVSPESDAAEVENVSREAQGAGLLSVRSEARDVAKMLEGYLAEAEAERSQTKSAGQKDYVKITIDEILEALSGLKGPEPVSDATMKIVNTYLPDLEVEKFDLSASEPFRKIKEGNEEKPLEANPEKARHMIRVERFFRALTTGNFDYFLNRLKHGTTSPDKDGYRKDLGRVKSVYDALTLDEKTEMWLEIKAHDFGYIFGNADVGHEASGADYAESFFQSDLLMSSQRARAVSSLIRRHMSAGSLYLGELRYTKFKEGLDEKGFEKLLLHNIADAASVLPDSMVYYPARLATVVTWLDSEARDRSLRNYDQYRFEKLAKSSMNSDQDLTPEEVSDLNKTIGAIFGAEEEKLRGQWRDSIDILNSLMMVSTRLAKGDDAYKRWAKWLRLLGQISLLAPGGEAVFNSNLRLRKYPVEFWYAADVINKKIEAAIDQIPDICDLAAVKAQMPPALTKDQRFVIYGMPFKWDGKEFWADVRSLYDDARPDPSDPIVRSEVRTPEEQTILDEARRTVFEPSFLKAEQAIAAGRLYTEESYSRYVEFRKVPGLKINLWERVANREGVPAVLYSLSAAVYPEEGHETVRGLIRLTDEFSKQPFAQKFFIFPREAYHLTLETFHLQKQPFSDEKIQDAQEKTGQMAKAREPFDIWVQGVTVDPEDGRIQAETILFDGKTPERRVITLYSPIRELTRDERAQLLEWVKRHREDTFGRIRAEKLQLVHSMNIFAHHNLSMNEYPLREAAAKSPGDKTEVSQSVLLGIPGAREAFQGWADEDIARLFKEYGLGELKAVQLRAHNDKSIPILETTRGFFGLKKITTFDPIDRERQMLFIADTVHRNKQKGTPIPALYRLGEEKRENLFFRITDTELHTQEYFMVERWITEYPSVHREEATPEMLQEAARWLYRIHAATEDVTDSDWKGLERWTREWQLRDMERGRVEDREQIKRFYSEEDSETILSVLDQALPKVSSLLRKLPLKPISSDFNFANCFFDADGKIREITDWEASRLGYRIEDFTSILFRTGRPRQGYVVGHLERDLIQILQAYQEAAGDRRLTDEEIDSLPGFFLVDFLGWFYVKDLKGVTGQGREATPNQRTMILRAIKEIQKQFAPYFNGEKSLSSEVKTALTASSRRSEVRYLPVAKETVQFQAGSSEVVSFRISPSSGRGVHVAIQEELQGRFGIDRNTETAFFREADGSLITDNAAVHEKIETDDAMIRRFEASHPSQTVVAAVDNSSLFANQGFVTFAHGKLFYPVGEDIRAHPYSSLILRKNGTFLMEDVSYRAGNNGTIHAFANGGEIQKDIDYATFGQFLLDGRGHPREDIESIIPQFQDLRHVYTLPKILARDLPDSSTGKLASKEEIYFDVSQMSRNGYALAQNAWKSPVRMDLTVALSFKEGTDRVTTEVAVPEAVLRKALKDSGYLENDGEITERGQFKFEEGKIKIFFKPGIYPRTLMGLTPGGELVVLGISGKSGRKGSTLVESAALASKYGLSQAMLLDHGGNAKIWANGDYALPSSQGRYLRTAAIFITVARSEMPLTPVAPKTSRDSREARSEMHLNSVDSSTTRDSLVVRSEMRGGPGDKTEVSPSALLGIPRAREAFAGWTDEDVARLFTEYGLGALKSVRFKRHDGRDIPILKTEQGLFCLKKLSRLSSANEERESLFIADIIHRNMRKGIPIPALFRFGMSEPANLIFSISNQSTHLKEYFVVENWIEGLKNVYREEASPPMLDEVVRWLASSHAATLDVSEERWAGLGRWTRSRNYEQMEESRTNGRERILQAYAPDEARTILSVLDDVFPGVWALSKKIPKKPINSDMNIANCFFDAAGRIRAITDWEDVRFGHRMEDFTSVVFRTGHPRQGYVTDHLEQYLLRALSVYQRTAGKQGLTDAEIDILPGYFLVDFLGWFYRRDGARILGDGATAAPEQRQSVLNTIRKVQESFEPYLKGQKSLSRELRQFVLRNDRTGKPDDAARPAKRPKIELSAAELNDALAVISIFREWKFSFAALEKKIRELLAFNGPGAKVVHAAVFESVADMVEAMLGPRNPRDKMVGLAGEISGVYREVIKRSKSLKKINVGVIRAIHEFVRDSSGKEWDAVSKNTVFEFKFFLSLRKLYQQVIGGLDSAKYPHMRVLVENPKYKKIRNIVYFGEMDDGYVNRAIVAFMKNGPHSMPSVEIEDNKDVFVRFSLEGIKEFLLSKTVQDLAKQEYRQFFKKRTVLPKWVPGVWIDRKIEQMRKVPNGKFDVYIGVSNAPAKDVAEIQKFVSSRPAVRAQNRSDVREAGKTLALKMNPLSTVVVTIDGPSGSGKGTAGLELARRLGYLYVDSGVIFRAIAYKMIREGIDPLNEAAVTAVLEKTSVSLDAKGSDLQVLLDRASVTDVIRSQEVTRVVAEVSQYKAVQIFVLQKIRETGEKYNAVVDGRQMGTEVFPDATGTKFYLDSPVEVRARRRAEQFRAKEGSQAVSIEDVMAKIQQRDDLDRRRTFAPLRQPSDAVVIVNGSDQTISGIVDQMETQVRKDLAEKRGRGTWDVLSGVVSERLRQLPARAVLLVGGPSATGKTWMLDEFNRLMAGQGRKIEWVPEDRYFKPEDECPLRNGKPDFDHIDAYNLPVMTETIRKLNRDGTAVIPASTFGVAEPARTSQLGGRDIIGVEGLHSLHPRVMSALGPDVPVLKIFLDTPWQIRFMRRLFRDVEVRKFSDPFRTLALWDNVAAGEKSFVDPTREQADFVIERGSTEEARELGVLTREFREALSQRPEVIAREDYRKILSDVENYLKALPADRSEVRDSKGEDVAQKRLQATTQKMGSESFIASLQPRVAVVSERVISGDLGDRMVRNVRMGVQPATVFVDAEDFQNLSLAQKQEYLIVALSNKALHVVVYNERGQVQDKELGALLKLDRVTRTGQDLAGAQSRFDRPNAPSIHLSKKILPSTELVQRLRKRVSFFKTQGQKSGSLAVALLWALGGGETARFVGVNKDSDGFWRVAENLVNALQRSYDNNLVFATAA